VSATAVSIRNRIGYRTVALPGGRTLTVRPTVSADVDALAQLYESLPTDDLYDRFFSVYHPPRSFFERQARLNESGGCALVARLAGEDRTVGDAGYVMLPDGGGEFALTVAPDWRGWLGPYLLDVLVEAAAARGLPNLQADVLATNQRMMALLQRRGYVVLGNDDFSVLRVAIATTASMPFWPRRTGSPLILAEGPGVRWIGETEARRAGWRVVSCSRARIPGGRGCPALRQDQPCELVLNADVVVVGFPADQVGAALVAAHETLHPGVAVATCQGSREEQVAAVAAVLQSERKQKQRGESLAERKGTGQPDSRSSRSWAGDRRT
jgi:ribosomal protein S18 acetylase RimI-like enzyme